MDIDTIIAHYGLAAVFLGCFFEGETVAITGGVLAHRHLLVLWQVVVTVALAAMASDLFWFALGRRFRDQPRLRGIVERPAFRRAVAMLDRGPYRLAAVFRYIPGMRIVGPLALSHSRIPARHYVLIVTISGIVWALAFTVLGHTIGHLITQIFGRAHHAGIILALAFAALSIIGLWHLLRRRRAKP